MKPLPNTKSKKDPTHVPETTTTASTTRETPEIDVSPLLSLPKELLPIVLKNLDPISLLKLATVCKLLQEKADAQETWKQFFH